MNSFDKDVMIYLYKCLLRRRQALQSLKPIDRDTSPFDEAMDILTSSIHPDDIYEANRQMGILQARHIDVYVDASVKYHDNPGVPNKVSVSFLIYESGRLLYERAQFLGSYITLIVQDKPVVLDITVNVAEYLALVKALEFIVESEFKGDVTIHSDSLLMVNQVNFISSARAPKLIVLRDYVRRLKDRLHDVQIIHLSREENVNADALARTTEEYSSK